MTKLDKALDLGILNLEYANDNWFVLSFFSDYSHVFYYGGFVVDENLNIIRAICNSIEQFSLTRYKVQIITKSDNLNLNNFLGYWDKDWDRLFLILPTVDKNTSSTYWRDVINQHIKGKLYYGNFASIERFCVSDPYYIQAVINDKNIEKQVGSQLWCTRIVNENLGGLTNGLYHLGGCINNNLVN